MLSDSALARQMQVGYRDIDAEEKRGRKLAILEDKLEAARGAHRFVDSSDDDVDYDD